MIAFLLGDRSVLVYMKLPSTAEKDIDTRPAIGKANEDMIAYGTRSPTPRGKVRIVIARNCRNGSPDHSDLSECCISRPLRSQVVLASDSAGWTRQNRDKLRKDACFVSCD